MPGSHTTSAHVFLPNFQPDGPRHKEVKWLTQGQADVRNLLAISAGPVLRWLLWEWIWPKQQPHMQSRNLSFSCLAVSNRCSVGLNRCARYLHLTQPSCAHQQYSVCGCTLTIASGQDFLFTLALRQPLTSVQATWNICAMSLEITGA